jgi:hypothetical protein
VALAAIGGFALVHSVVVLLITDAPTSRTYVTVALEAVGAAVGLGGAFVSLRSLKVSRPAYRSTDHD